MSYGTNIAEIAALVGDPARANMLMALMDGRALTAGELAYVGGIVASTASGHLAKLLDANLIGVLQQGRHRYYRLASPLVGSMLESLMAVAAIEGPKRYRPSSCRDAALREARTCYNHLAGRLGVAIADAMLSREQLDMSGEAGLLTAAGRALLQDMGVVLSEASTSHRIFCKPCLDWSERRLHIGGSLGVAIADRCFGLGWIERQRDSRALRITAKGQAGFHRHFALEMRQ
ncbi:MAG TPA: helix-turn-helix transcriptional regulator [Dongiaceae bacterium]|nr:helix-turn-helix transcriptional regulator [Dongiaceae bacterium]